MRRAQRHATELLTFTLGFIAGIAALKACIDFCERTGQATPLPHFWVVWLFDANPIVYALCDVMQRRDLCIGLHLDGGPLESIEMGWLLFAQGTPFGLAALLVLLLWRRRARQSRRLSDVGQRSSSRG